MGACVSTSTNADHDVKRPTRKQAKSSSSIRGRSFSSSPETRFSRSGSSSSSPCNSNSPNSPCPSLVKQKLAPLETDFKKPAKRTLSSSLLLQVRSLTGSPVPTSRPVVRRTVRRTRSLCTPEGYVASNDSTAEEHLPGRRRSAGDIPANITQEVLQILTGKGGGEKTGEQNERTCENFVKDSTRADGTLGAGVMAGKEEEENGSEKYGPCQKDSGCDRNVSHTQGENTDSLDVQHVISVDWHYPLTEEKTGSEFSTNHAHSLDLGGIDALKRETSCIGVHEKKRQEVDDEDKTVVAEEDDEDKTVVAEGAIRGWPLLAIGTVNETKSSELVPEMTALLSQFSDADESKNEVPVAGLETAPESFLEVNLERISTAERMENLSVEMEAFLENVRKTSIRKASLSETGTTVELVEQKKSQTGMSSESSTATLGKSIPVSPRTSPRKPASPKASRPPKPKPSGKTNPVDKFFIGTSLFDLSALIDEENDLDKNENEDVAMFDPALLATFEEAFQQYSKEDWMDASRNESPRRRSLEVWAKAVAKAASLKEEKQTNESGPWDGIALGENSSSPTSVLSPSSILSTSSCSSNHSPKQIVSRDVWASEGEPEVSSKSWESNSNRCVEEERDAKEKSDMLGKEDLRLSDSSTIDIAAVFDRFLSVQPESTNMGFSDTSLSKSSLSTGITA